MATFNSAGDPDQEPASDPDQELDGHG